MRELYENGSLVERWDDDTRTYTAWNTRGVQTSTRPYTSDENAQANEVARQNAQADEAARQNAQADEAARQNAQVPDLTERVAAIEAYLFTTVPPSEDGVPLSENPPR